MLNVNVKKNDDSTIGLEIDMEQNVTINDLVASYVAIGEKFAEIIEFSTEKAATPTSKNTAMLLFLDRLDRHRKVMMSQLSDVSFTPEEDA